jgi:RHS repeat-associated protein
VNFAICGSVEGCITIRPYHFLQEDGYYSYDYEAARTNPIDGLKWHKIDSIFVYSNEDQLRQIIAFDYNNTATERLKLDKMKYLPLDYLSDAGTPPIEYSFEYDDFDELPPYFSRKLDHFGYYSGTEEYTSSDVFNYSNWETNYYPSRESNPDSVLIGMLTKVNIPTGGSLEFEYEIHDYGHVLSDDKQSLSTETGIIGGVRTKKIQYHDGVSTGPVMSKSYKYVHDYENSGAQSSGILGLQPRYVWIQWESPTDWYPDGGYRESKWSTNFVVPMVSLLEPHITYSQVVEEYDDDSYEICSFLSHHELKDILPYATAQLQASQYDRFSDLSYYRGKLIEKRKFNESDEVVFTQKTYYDIPFHDSQYDEYGLHIDAQLGFSCQASNDDKYYYGNANRIFHSKLLIDSIEHIYHYGSNQFAITEKFEYFTPVIAGNKYAFVKEKDIVNSDGKIYKDYYEYPQFHVTSIAGQQELLDSLIATHRIIPVVRAKKVNGTIVDRYLDAYDWQQGAAMPQYTERTKVTWLNQTYQSTDETVMHYDEWNMDFLIPTETRNQDWIPNKITLNARGLVTATEFGDHVTSISYYPNDLPAEYTAIDGTTQEFEYDEFSRLAQKTHLPRNVQEIYEYYYSHDPMDRSFFKQKTEFPPAANSDLDSIVTISYLDGLGRKVQKIRKYAAAETHADVLTAMTYDSKGRLEREYFPMALQDNHGAYYYGSITSPWQSYSYEDDPLNRMAATTPPQFDPMQYEYGVNTSTITDPENTEYPAGTLHIQRTIDADGNITEVFSDKLGRAVLNRQRKDQENIDTWTLYDNKGRPEKIYPPGSTASTPELIYQYQYDGSDNVISKKSPDAATENFRYSERNLNTAYRNAILEGQGHWMVSHYDQYGRVTKRGLHEGSDPGTQENPTIHTLLEEYFYDGFNGSTQLTNPIYTGRLRRKRIKLLEDAQSNSQWEDIIYVYDIYGRVSTENINNHRGGTETINYTYDYADNVTANTNNIIGLGGITHTQRMNYDHQGRLRRQMINLNGTGLRTLYELDYNHRDEVSARRIGQAQLSDPDVFLQCIDYQYNHRGWLTHINDIYGGPYLYQDYPCDTGSEQEEEQEEEDEEESFFFSQNQDLFRMTLRYNQAMPGSGITPSMNGNISGIISQYGQNMPHVNNYGYDHLNRLNITNHGIYPDGLFEYRGHSNENFSYDERGNILTLNRKGLVHRFDIHTNCYQPETIDSLLYIYEEDTNRLIKVEERSPCPQVITLPPLIEVDRSYAAGKEIRVLETKVDCDVELNLHAGQQIRIIESLEIPSDCGIAALVNTYGAPCPENSFTEGFHQASEEGLYLYDDAGNMTFDPNKGLTFHYNHLNLPYKIENQHGAELIMNYLADGTLAQKILYKNTAQIRKTDYLRGKEYRNDTLEAVYHDDGRVRHEDGAFFYEYKLKDHLGNTRVVFEDTNGDGQIQASEVKSRHDYYAFGMEQFRPPGSTSGPDSYRYLYNGKELLREMEIGLYHYGARQMDPVLGRFWQVDPLVDVFKNQSPYLYAYNNPLLFIDVDGLYGDESEAKMQRISAQLSGHKVGGVYQSGEEWGFNIIDGESSYSVFERDFFQNFESSRDNLQGASFADPGLSKVGKSAAYHVFGMGYSGYSAPGMALQNVSSIKAIDMPLSPGKYNSAIGKGLGFLANLDALISMTSVPKEIVNDVGYFDNKVEPNIHRTGSKVVGGPEGTSVMTLLSMKGDTASHITYKGRNPIDTSTYVARRQSGLIKFSNKNTNIYKVPGVVKNPRQ